MRAHRLASGLLVLPAEVPSIALWRERGACWSCNESLDCDLATAVHYVCGPPNPLKPRKRVLYECVWSLTAFLTERIDGRGGVGEERGGGDEPTHDSEGSSRLCRACRDRPHGTG